VSRSRSEPGICFPPFEKEQHNESGIAVGRKNWLFAGSKTGGERAAAIYTVVETCKANGIEPQAYIADVTAKIAADWPARLTSPIQIAT